MAFVEFNQTVTGVRRAAGTYVNGVFVPGAETPLSIESSVQPASEIELRLLPEARREDGAYSLRSESEIRNGDIFTLFGDEYEVLRLQVWQNGIIPHYLCIAVRMNQS